MSPGSKASSCVCLSCASLATPLLCRQPSLGVCMWSLLQGTRRKGAMGAWCWDHWKRGLREAPESCERCPSPNGRQSLQVLGSLILAPSLVSYTPLIPNPRLPASEPWRPASACVCFKYVLVQLRAWVNSDVPSYSCFCSYHVYLCSHWGSPPGSSHSQVSCSCE